MSLPKVKILPMPQRFIDVGHYVVDHIPTSRTESPEADFYSESPERHQYLPYGTSGSRSRSTSTAADNIDRLNVMPARKRILLEQRQLRDARRSSSRGPDPKAPVVGWEQRQKRDELEAQRIQRITDRSRSNDARTSKTYTSHATAPSDGLINWTKGKRGISMQRSSSASERGGFLRCAGSANGLQAETMGSADASSPGPGHYSRSISFITPVVGPKTSNFASRMNGQRDGWTSKFPKVLQPKY